MSEQLLYTVYISPDAKTPSMRLPLKAIEQKLCKNGGTMAFLQCVHLATLGYKITIYYTDYGAKKKVKKGESINKGEYNVIASYLALTKLFGPAFVVSTDPLSEEDMKKMTKECTTIVTANPKYRSLATAAAQRRSTVQTPGGKKLGDAIASVKNKIDINGIKDADSLIKSIGAAVARSDNITTGIRGVMGDDLKNIDGIVSQVTKSVVENKDKIDTNNLGEVVHNVVKAVIKPPPDPLMMQGEEVQPDITKAISSAVNAVTAALPPIEKENILVPRGVAPNTAVLFNGSE